MSKNKFNKPNRIKQTSELRKEFYKRLLYIALCFIPIIIFADDKGTFRLIPLPFFLIGMYHLIKIITLSQPIIDDFFPPKTLYEKTTKPFDKFVYYFSSTLFFVGLIFLTFEIKNFDNTINGAKLFWRAGFTGFGLAIILTVILKLTRPSIYYESKRRFTVHFGLFIGLFFAAAALTSFINRHFADPAPFCKKYIIVKKSTSSGRSTEYFFFLTINNNEERFSVGKKRYDNFRNGEEIELCMLRGKLGFDFVKEFNKTEE